MKPLKVDMKHFTEQDFPVLDTFFRRNLINCLSGYKSVNLLGTISKEGVTNLAIFSQVFHIGANPPLVGVLFRPHTVERGTLENILETKYFTLNHITEGFYQEAHHTSARWDVSEFAACGLEEEYKDEFIAPYVKGSPLQVGLEWVDRKDLEINGTILMIGAIRELYIQENAIGEDGFIDLGALGTITCSGLDGYHRVEKIARLSYAKPDHKPKVIS